MWVVDGFFGINQVWFLFLLFLWVVLLFMALGH
jgi:hypothetical protein